MKNWTRDRVTQESRDFLGSLCSARHFKRSLLCRFGKRL